MNTSPASFDFRKLTILVIDDDPWMRLLIKKYLTVFGVTHVFEAENGRQGLLSLTANRPDIVLCDILMPELNGFEFLHRMRSSGFSCDNVPVIFLTGDADPDYLPSAQQLGADAVLFKPVSAQALRTKIAHVLSYARPHPPSSGHGS